MSQDELDERLKRLQEASSQFVEGTFEEMQDKSTHESADVRALAASRLMNLEDRRAVPILISLMGDSSSRVRFAAALGLGHYEAPEARDVLINRLRNDEFADVRAVCASSLGYVGGAEEEIIRALDDPDWQVKGMATTTLNRLRRTDAAPKMLENLDDPEWSVRYYSAVALLDFGVSNSKVIEALNGLREDPDAVETISWFADEDIWLEVCEKFSDEIEELDDDCSADEAVDILRKRHGEDAIPYPPKDPLGDLIERAIELAG